MTTKLEGSHASGCTVHYSEIQRCWISYAYWTGGGAMFKAQTEAEAWRAAREAEDQGVRAHRGQ